MRFKNVLWLSLMGRLEVSLAFAPTQKAIGVTKLSSLQVTSTRSCLGRERKQEKTCARTCCFREGQNAPVPIKIGVGYLKALPTDSSDSHSNELSQEEGNELYLHELSKSPKHTVAETPPSALQQQKQQLTNLQQQMEQLRQENERLQNQLTIQQNFIQNNPTLLEGENRPMLILESFEGDGSWFTRGEIFKRGEGDKENEIHNLKTPPEEITQQPMSTIIAPSDEVLSNQMTKNAFTVDGADALTIGPISSLEGSTSASTLSSATGVQQELDELWCNDMEEANDGGTCPIEPNISFRDALRDRAYWLVGLLAMQSCSGFILARNELLLQNHPVIIYFLTMLVGAGGNAGNQASVRVIRGLALGSLSEKTQGQFIRREIKMAFSLSSILAVAGFIRAIFFRTPFPETIAITTALLLIVFTSICLGAVLPLGLKRIGVDPAHSSTSIQVIMDILGVVMTVIISGFMLDSPLGKFFIASLGGSLG